MGGGQECLVELLLQLRISCRRLSHRDGLPLLVNLTADEFALLMASGDKPSGASVADTGEFLPIVVRLAQAQELGVRPCCRSRAYMGEGISHDAEVPDPVACHGQRVLLGRSYYHCIFTRAQCICGREDDVRATNLLLRDDDVFVNA